MFAAGKMSIDMTVIFDTILQPVDEIEQIQGICN
jgi:hypothetical protein